LDTSPWKTSMSLQEELVCVFKRKWDVSLRGDFYI
jgi:hypothetical protein